MLNLIMFYSVSASGLYFSLFRSPAYAFVLYEVMYFFTPQFRWWGYMAPNISYSFYIVLLMIGLMLVNIKRLQQNKLLAIPQFRWVYISVALYLIASFYAVSPQLHLEFAINYLKLAIIISVAYKLVDSIVKLDHILYAYIFGAWYIGFITYQAGRNASGRVEGIGTISAPDTNDIAAAIAPTVVLCLYYFWSSNKWIGKILAVIAGVFIANGLILINSRGAFLGVIISISYFMCYMLFSSLQKKNQKTIAVAIIIAGLAGTAVIVDDSAISRFTSISNTEWDEEQETGKTRMFFWLAAWEMAKDHPLGTGFLGFNHYAPLYIQENVDTGEHRNRSVHSSWFESLSETGYLGLLAFLMIFYCAFKTLSQCKKRLRSLSKVDDYFKVIAIQAALLSFIISMSFINRMKAEVLYWLILYTACAYNIYILQGDKAHDGKTTNNTTPCK